MQCPDLTIEKEYTRGHLLPPDVSLDEKGGIINCYELMLFPEDHDGGVVLDGIFYPASAGHFVRCKPAQHRRFQVPVRCYVLAFSTNDPQLKASLDALPTTALHPDMAQLIELYWKFYYIPTRTTLPDRLAICSYSTAFLHLLLQPEYPLEAVQEGNPRRHREALLAANQYLKEHLAEDVDLNKLAQDSHLHPTYFHKLFKEAFGKTPAQQLMHHRILASREYLRQDNCTIAEIARKCGFPSQSYYCRKYKELSLETPSRFRNAIRKRRTK